MGEFGVLELSQLKQMLASQATFFEEMSRAGSMLLIYWVGLRSLNICIVQIQAVSKIKASSVLVRSYVGFLQFSGNLVHVGI